MSEMILSGKTLKKKMSIKENTVLYDRTKENEMELIMNQCPTNMCHASTVLKLDAGRLLFAWFGGSEEGNGDTAVWMTRRTKEGFQIPQKVAQSREAHWNPVLFRISETKILLFYKVGDTIAAWRTMYRISENNGESFGEELELAAGDKGGRGPVRNKPIRLRNGRILAPASTEHGVWTAFVDISDDDAATWKRSEEVGIAGLNYRYNERIVNKYESTIPVSEQSFHGRGVIQPTLWEGVEDGCVHMLLRSTEGQIYRSDSRDYGATWTHAYPTDLPNNNSGIDLVKDPAGRLYLIYNPVGTNWGPRTPISLAVSEDNGETWRREKDLSHGDGEFAYPAVIADDEFLYITFTFRRQNIAFWKLSI